MPAEKGQAAAASFARVATRVHLLRPGRRIAVYLRHGSEADPSALITLARQRHCKVYVPVIRNYRRREMVFVRYDDAAPLRRNRFGIFEPTQGVTRRSAVGGLDLVFLPLLAVDPHGSRLGSGLGFYDRALHHLRTGRGWRRPALIGVAYEFQRVDHLEPERWDIPLDALITERDFYPLHPAA